MSGSNRVTGGNRWPSATVSAVPGLTCPRPGVQVSHKALRRALALQGLSFCRTLQNPSFPAANRRALGPPVRSFHKVSYPVITRFDKLQTELPHPKNPSANSAAAVQELLGAKFGEMSTFMNYTSQSFNFRGCRKMRPFYDSHCKYRR